jgi:hypothetical protein
VVELCRELELWFGVADGMHSRKGWVDLVIVGYWRAGHPRPVLAVELKTEDGRRETAQIVCSTALTAAGLRYRLWRPSDYESGAVRRELEGIAPPAC